MITTSAVVPAAPGTVYDLLVDIGAWSLWSPHISGTEPATGTLAAGDRIRVKAWFAPTPTTMVVTGADPSHGLTWETEAAGYRLRYANGVEGVDGGARITFTAELSGPGGPLVERVVAPLSALGQRRRIERLGHLAGLVERR